MLVYGDHALDRDPRAVIAELHDTLSSLARPAASPALETHARLVGAFLDAAELAQGLADAETVARGHDHAGPLGDRAMAVARALAGSIIASWRGAVARPAAAARHLTALRATRLPDAIRTKRAEGHAYYAVYPEAYAEAARRAPPGPRRVIGLRSIGTGLAAMVAAATGAPTPSTVRPVGDPWRRAIAADDELVRTWCEPGAVVAVVDEGPGLSGSSFAAVLDLLAARGVREERIECYPSHRGDLGPVARDHHRARWARIARRVVDADELLVSSGRLARWIAGAVGPLVAPLQDLSAGAWRALHYARTDAWPPVIPQQERRKFLARTANATYVARFIGLGRHGAHAYARARTLAAAGYTPEVHGLLHGFAVERWVDGHPLDPRAATRVQLVDHVARYLAFRARAFPAPPTRGASARALLEMARRNTALALGAAAGDPLDRFTATALEARMRRIEIDGRLHAWEWLVRADGTLVKTDAVDHHAAHDLVGCQDLAWDLAGATFELGLDRDEEDRLVAAANRLAGRAHDPELLAFARICYLAFQLGRHALAGANATGYMEALRAELHSTARAAARGAR